MFKHLYTHRHYIWKAAWNDLRYRYAGTELGVFWHVINPLLEVLIYTVVFTRVLVVRAGGEQEAFFVLFLCVGLFPWLSFAETILQGSDAFLQNANYLRRLALPAEIFVAKNVLTSTLSLYISLILLLLLSLLLDKPLSWSWLTLPAVALLLQCLAFGFALTLATLRVFFRDVGEVLRALMQLWKWTMPIIYPEALVPERFQPWLVLNPPYVFIQAIRSVLLEQRFPPLAAWATMFAWIFLSILLAAVVMQKLRSEIKDKL
jgi:ABC-type polysaccharide/polyol phosphate export permease